MLRPLRNLSLTWWIFIGMGAGILIGWLFPESAATLKPLSTVFLRMIKSVVVPIIFGTMVVGIAMSISAPRATFEAFFGIRVQDAEEGGWTAGGARELPVPADLAGRVHAVTFEPPAEAVTTP